MGKFRFKICFFGGLRFIKIIGLALGAVFHRQGNLFVTFFGYKSDCFFCGFQAFCSVEWKMFGLVQQLQHFG